MTRSVFAPGLDRLPASGQAQGGFQPGSGAGGVFAGVLQGATPKYAINAGFRADLFRNTLARMFVRVDASEMNLFLSSIGDTHTRSQLAERIAGDPAPISEGRANAGGGSTTDATVRRSSNAQVNGYLDFLIQNIQMPLQEKVQVSETLSDNYVAYAFGQSPPVWTFSGSLINSVQDDQASNMFRLYTHILRATQMARRQKSLSLSYDSYVVNGVMMSMTLGLTSNNELVVPFTFQLLVKRVFITNYTAGWVPTAATTPFAADLNAIAWDGRPREEGALVRIAARLIEGNEDATPTPHAQEDPRVRDNRDALASGTNPPSFMDVVSRISVTNIAANLAESAAARASAAVRRRANALVDAARVRAEALAFGAAEQIENAAEAARQAAIREAYRLTGTSPGQISGLRNDVVGAINDARSDAQAISDGAAEIQAGIRRGAEAAAAASVRNPQNPESDGIPGVRSSETLGEELGPGSTSSPTPTSVPTF